MDILFWNIQQFGFNKFQDANVQACIMTTIYPPVGAPVVPGILVVIEVCARGTPIGSVPTGAGAQGMAALLAALQGQDANWLALPPISLANSIGRAEAIGVFYRQNVVTFTGPHVWTNYGPLPAAQVAAQTPPWTALFTNGAPAVAPYPGPWNAAAPFNVVGAPAPQIDFVNAAGTAFVEFPAVGYRRPLRAQFTQVVGGGTIDLWAMHTTPSQAVAGVQSLGTVPDLAVAPGANNIRILCGDFNVEAEDDANFLAAYGPLVALGYTPQLANGASVPTMFEQDDPLYNDYISMLSVDNALTWAGGGVAVAACWVINRVGIAPAGQYTCSLATPLALYAGIAAGAPRANAFQSWANFGHIGNRQRHGAAIGYRGTSDHLPLLLRF